MIKMKKMIVFWLGFLFCVMAISVFAEQTETVYDSVRLSETEISQYKKSSDGQLIKLYNVESPEDYFVAKEDLGKWFAENNQLSLFYVTIDSNQTIYEYVGPKVGTIPHNSGNWESLYRYAVYPEEVFGTDSDIVVKNVYCFNSEFSGDYVLSYNRGVFIYYVTNLGDFILHKPDSKQGKTYILPLEAFLRYMESARAYYRSVSNNNGAPSNIAQCGFDLEKYRLESFALPSAPMEENASPAWYIWTLVALGGAVIGAGGAIAIGTAIRRKKKA